MAEEKCQDCPLRVDCLIETICLDSEQLKEKIVERLILQALLSYKPKVPGIIIHQELSPRDRKIVRTLKAKHFNHRVAGVL